VAPKDKKTTVRDGAPRWSLSDALKEFPISDAAARKIKRTQERLFELQRRYIELENPNNEDWGRLVALNDPTWRFAHEEQRRLAAGWSQERLQAWLNSANAWTNTVGRFSHVLTFDEIKRGLEREDWTFASAQAFVSAKVEAIHASLQPKIDQLQNELRVQKAIRQIEAFRKADLAMFARAGSPSAGHTIVDMAKILGRNPAWGSVPETIALDGSDSLFRVYLVNHSDIKEQSAPGKSEGGRRTLIRSFLMREKLFDNRRGLTLKQITRELVIPFLKTKRCDIPNDDTHVFESIYREVCRIFREPR
jgi:hypothetical protein